MYSITFIIFHFKCFMLVRVAGDPEPEPGTLYMEGGILNGMPVCYRGTMHTHIHTHRQFNIASLTYSLFLRLGGNFRTWRKLTQTLGGHVKLHSWNSWAHDRAGTLELSGSNADCLCGRLAHEKATKAVILLYYIYIFVCLA